MTVRVMGTEAPSARQRRPYNRALGATGTFDAAPLGV
jgi:hypothetical protein